MSTRGAGGGYHLARPAAEITPWEVIGVLGGSFFPDGFCENHPGQLLDCVHTTDYAVRSLWRKVEGVVRELLQSITLEDLQQREQHMLLRLQMPASVPPGMRGPAER